MEPPLNKSLPFIHLITDGGRLRRSARLVPTLCDLISRHSSYIAAVHLREQVGESPASDLEVRALLDTLSPFCSEWKVPLYLNRRIDLASSYPGVGVHLGGGLPTAETLAVLKDAEIAFGFSAHSLSEIEQILPNKPQYVYLSPIFAPHSKPADTRVPLGLEKLKSGLALVTPRQGTIVVALGGISPERAAGLRGSGCQAIALLGQVLGSDNPEAGLIAMRDAWLQA